MEKEIINNNYNNNKYNNNNNNNNRTCQLFYKLFHNKFIRSIILNHLKLYKKNRIVNFSTIRELRNYQFREYIEIIEFDGENQELSKGDLPMYGVLKKFIIKCNNNCLPSYGNECVIPDTVDTIQYSYKSYPSDMTLSFNLINKFIKSINKIENCMIDPTMKDYSSCYHGNGGNLLYFNFNLSPIFETLPSNLTSVSFHSNWNYRITHGFIGSNIKELIFGSKFNNDGNSLEIGDIPFGVEKLSLGGYKCSMFLNDGKGIIPNSLPLSITDLTISISSNNFLKLSSIPSSVKILNLFTPDYDDDESDFYNYGVKIIISEIGIIPNGIEKLNIDSNKIEISSWSILPNSIKHLIINQIPQDEPIVKGTLPDCLEYLYLNSNFKFNFEIASFPIGLKELQLGGKCYNQPFKPNVLPKSLTSLQLPSNYNQPLEIGSLPKGLIKFIAGDHKITTPGILPLSLKELTIQRCSYDFEIGTLPSNLIYLKLPLEFNQLFVKPGILPHSITNLQFGSYYNQPLSKSILPPNLKTLTFYSPITPSIYSHPLIDILPSSLIYLFIANPYYSHPIGKRYKTPCFIKKFGKNFYKNIKPKKLKSSL